MRIVTRGRKYNVTCEMPFLYLPECSFALDHTGERCFAIYYCESGTTFLKAGDKTLVITSPCIVGINNKIKPEDNPPGAVGGKTVYFHPSVLNPAFTAENIFSDSHPFSVMQLQDRHLLQPFLDQKSNAFLLGLSGLEKKRIGFLFERIRGELDGQEDVLWPCRSRSFLVELLFFLRTLATSESEGAFESPAPPDELWNVLLWLHINYMDEIMLPALAKRFGTNKTTLNQRFRQRTGRSVKQYLIALRIQLASILLRVTALSIKEIMERAGFKDQAYFNRAFKKLMTLSPLKFRETCGLAR